MINGATGGADMYFNRDGTWRWIAHETGHAFGLVDEDLDHRTPTLGYWSIRAMNWSLAALGSLGGGYRARRRPGSVDPNFEDAALHPGDTVVIEGIAVTVTGSGPAGDIVQIRM